MVEGVGLRVVGQAVFVHVLVAGESGHADRFERLVIRAADAPQAQAFEARHVLQRFQFRFQNLLHGLAALHAEAVHRTGSGVVDQRTTRLFHLVLVLLHVGLAAVKPLLFAAEQYEADGPLRLEAGFGQRPQGAGTFQHGTGAGAVVGGPGAKVPRVDVCADDHEFVGLFATTDFAHGVVDGDRAGHELVGDLDFHLRWGAVLHRGKAVQHPVVFVRDEQAWQWLRGRCGTVAASSAHRIPARPAPAHRQQSVRLGGISQHHGCTFGTEEVGHRPLQGHHLAEARATTTTTGWWLCRRVLLGFLFLRLFLLGVVFLGFILLDFRSHRGRSTHRCCGLGWPLGRVEVRQVADRLDLRRWRPQDDRVL